MGCKQSKMKAEEWHLHKQRRKLSGRKPPTGNEDDASDGGDIPPFVPADDLLQWYDARIEDARKTFFGSATALDKPLGTASSQAGVHGNKNKNGSADAAGKHGVLTLYQVAPVNHVIGQGYFSKVTLADMVVHITTADALVKGGIEAHLNCCRDGTHRAPLRTTVTKAPTTTLYTSPKYLIACKEYTLAENSASYIHNQLRKEVQQLTRLTYSPRLLKVLQMEPVYNDPKSAGSEASTRSKFLEGISFYSSVGTGSAKHNLNIGGQAASACNCHETPAKVRIYMEYARYGTLRNVLLNETPCKFGKLYMHELTVRAYLREVLMALAFLHENNVVHSDLCAKNIYISNHLNDVYATCFPAYIADIPAGRFAKVPAAWVRRVLALMDPECMQPQYDSGDGRVPNDSIMTHLGVIYTAENSAMQSPGDAEVSVTAPPIVVEGGQGQQFQAASPGNPAAAAAAAAGNNNNSRNQNNNADENEGEEDRCRWMDLEVKMFLQENAYTEDDNIPLPSPLSGVEETEVFNSPTLDGVTIVRNGSFARSTQHLSPAPVFPFPVLPGESSHNLVKPSYGGAFNKDVSLVPLGVEGRMHAQIDSSGNGCVMSEMPMHPPKKRLSVRRPRKPLIKLGHYGRIRSIIVGNQSEAVHRLGRVTHMAPEIARGGSFAPASDIYAFAMTFIELTTPNGGVFGDLRPANMELPRTRQEKNEYDAAWLKNVKRYLLRNDNVVPLPSQLSEECKAMLRLCLQYDPARRPTAVELLQSKYFLLGHWVNVATKDGNIEAPWCHTNYEAAAEAAGLPRLPSDMGLYTAAS
ncbi:putative protein kinase [Trypanosoma rangeli]|uniref:Protein kinase domain-containing protein n=1 Tax=Trypanosoma rangeli TaxID=5698 RepID=A0A3R7K177_TRYRA|nr:putative protein kinase [Trypanosoma rangeli]RNF00015.1 putative protein kinase [Trypanosoma rangeli]|eukprot:RNF00015.1 putative protein kinase [Trypanosoma rangeli]